MALELNKSSSNSIMLIPIISSAFFDFVTNIIKRRTNKQMFRIDARWIIALMAHVHTLWYFAKSQFVTKSMNSVILPLGLEKAIAVATPSFSPFPAVICLTTSKSSMVLSKWCFFREKFKSAVSFKTTIVSRTHALSDFISTFTVFYNASFHIIHCNPKGILNQYKYGE